MVFFNSVYLSRSSVFKLFIDSIVDNFLVLRDVPEALSLRLFWLGVRSLCSKKLLINIGLLFLIEELD